MKALPAAFDTPSAINDRGQIVGGCSLWERGKLRNLGPPPRKGWECAAFLINDRGQVAGNLIETATLRMHAFIWQGARCATSERCQARDRAPLSSGRRGSRLAAHAVPVAVEVVWTGRQHLELRYRVRLQSRSGDGFGFYRLPFGRNDRCLPSGRASTCEGTLTRRFRAAHDGEAGLLSSWRGPEPNASLRSPERT
jgi:hypothetical protein